ncbi:hypothetical protein AOQ84DRAFT_365328 [Glonium stellatum]|uniref:Uncharacterized protein n=1 Tax=Glonium stellatum TaxID=574774 RepID=A0A8E2JRN9_9PEZI|nr:hypothetical protein AOQ84DRAFT_365328 [Glonium stellatum]
MESEQLEIGIGFLTSWEQMDLSSLEIPLASHAEIRLGEAEHVNGKPREPSPLEQPFMEQRYLFHLVNVSRRLLTQAFTNYEQALGNLPLIATRTPNGRSHASTAKRHSPANTIKKGMRKHIPGRRNSNTTAGSCLHDRIRLRSIKEEKLLGRFAVDYWGNIYGMRDLHLRRNWQAWVQTQRMLQEPLEFFGRQKIIVYHRGQRRPSKALA